MIEGRNVSKQEVSKSFRGILRISPNNEGADLGLDEVNEKAISDSIGNESTFLLGQKSATISNLVAQDLKIPNKLTFNTTTNIPTTVPKENDILVGDNAGNYTIKDLLEIIKTELDKANIFQSIVPVGTVFYSAMKSRDITNLPLVYQNDYLIPNGQSLNTTEYPELFKLIGYTFGGSGNTFKLPNLSNRFIRCAGASTTYNNEGTYTIPTHEPGNYELPQTNLYGLKLLPASETSSGFIESVYPPNQVSAGGCFDVSYVRNPGYGYRGGNQDFLVYRINLNGLLFKNIDISAKETHPYNVTLVPLIKLK